jgi:hypothetical protein
MICWAIPGWPTHEETLREISRPDLDHRQRELPQYPATDLHDFSILKSDPPIRRRPSTACSTWAGGHKTDDIDLVNFFIDALMDLGFQPPSAGGGRRVADRVNSAHC